MPPARWQPRQFFARIRTISLLKVILVVMISCAALCQEARHVAVGAQDEFELSSAHRLAQLISQRQADLDLRGRGSDRQPRAPALVHAERYRDDKSSRGHSRSHARQTESARGKPQD